MKVKTGSVALPVFYFAVSSRKRRETELFLGDAHRESGVFSLCFALSPVESCSPPKLSELTGQVYAGGRVGARGKGM